MASKYTRLEAKGPAAMVSQVLGEMSRSPSLKLQQFQGCRAIIELLKSQSNPTKLRVAAELSDAAEILATAMLTHRQSASVQSEACWALWHLASPSFVLDALDCGVVDVIADAIRVHLSSAELCEAACRVLQAVTLDKEGRLQVLKLGVLDLVLAILRTHLYDGNVAEQACWVLLNLSIDDECRNSIGIRGGPPLIVAAMKAHPDRISCCIWTEKLHAAARRPPPRVQLLRPRRQADDGAGAEVQWTRLKAAKRIASMLDSSSVYCGWAWGGEWDTDADGAAYAVLVPPDGGASVRVRLASKPDADRTTGPSRDPQSELLRERQPVIEEEEADSEEEDTPIVLTPRSAAKEAAKRKEALQRAVDRQGPGDKSKRELRSQLRKIKLGAQMRRPSMLSVVIPATPKTPSNSWTPTSRASESPLPATPLVAHTGMSRVRRGGFINAFSSNSLNSIHASADGKEMGNDRIASTNEIFYKDLREQVNVSMTVKAFRQRLEAQPGMQLPPAPHKLEDVESAVGHLLKELEDLKDLNRHL
jgi:hypothetical protein